MQFLGLTVRFPRFECRVTAILASAVNNLVILGSRNPSKQKQILSQRSIVIGTALLSKPQIIVHRDLEVLLRPQITLGGLNRRVPQEELDLLEIPAVLAADQQRQDHVVAFVLESRTVRKSQQLLGLLSFFLY